MQEKYVNWTLGYGLDLVMIQITKYNMGYQAINIKCMWVIVRIHMSLTNNDEHKKKIQDMYINMMK